MLLTSTPSTLIHYQEYKIMLHFPHQPSRQLPPKSYTYKNKMNLLSSSQLVFVDVRIYILHMQLLHPLLLTRHFIILLYEVQIKLVAIVTNLLLCEYNNNTCLYHM